MGAQGRRVFLSHTAELRLPAGSGAFVAAAKRAVKLAGDVPMGAEYVAFGERSPVEVCHERMAQCDVYVLVAGFWYGSLVWDGPSVSYPDLEFEVATGLDMPRLVFLLDEEMQGPGALVEVPERRARQQAFHRRLISSGLPVRLVRSPAELETAVAQALAELPAFDTDSAESGKTPRDELPVRAEPLRGHPGVPTAGEPLFEDLPAAKRLADKLRSLRELKVAISVEILKKDYAAAEQFAKIARKHAVTALEAALECVAHTPKQRGRIPEDDIRNAEQLLMITPGTFSSFFDEKRRPRRTGGKGARGGAREYPQAHRQHSGRHRNRNVTVVVAAGSSDLFRGSHRCARGGSAGRVRRLRSGEQGGHQGRVSRWPRAPRAPKRPTTRWNDCRSLQALARRWHPISVIDHIPTEQPARCRPCRRNSGATTTRPHIPINVIDHIPTEQPARCHPCRRNSGATTTRPHILVRRTRSRHAAIRSRQTARSMVRYPVSASEYRPHGSPAGALSCSSRLPHLRQPTQVIKLACMEIRACCVTFFARRTSHMPR